MSRVITLDQPALVCAILREIADQCEKQGLTTLNTDNFAPTMNAVIEGANLIKARIDLVGLQAKGSA